MLFKGFMFWIQYLFESYNRYHNYKFPGFKTIYCRFRGHPYDIFYYSSGIAPNTKCKNCGEDLG